MKIRLKCRICGKTYKDEIILSNGWETDAFIHFDGPGFCKEHAKIAGFINDQCSECMYHETPFKNCWLFDTIRSNGITKDQINTLLSGRCPLIINRLSLKTKDYTNTERNKAAGAAIVHAITNKEIV